MGKWDAGDIREDSDAKSLSSFLHAFHVFFPFDE